MSSDLNQTVQDSAKKAAESKFTSEASETKAKSESNEKERIEAERKIVAEAEDKARKVAEEQYIRLAEEEKRKVGLLIQSFMVYFRFVFIYLFSLSVGSAMCSFDRWPKLSSKLSRNKKRARSKRKKKLESKTRRN